jgi:hypothetical protein
MSPIGDKSSGYILSIFVLLVGIAVSTFHIPFLNPNFAKVLTYLLFGGLFILGVITSRGNLIYIAEVLTGSFPRRIAIYLAAFSLLAISDRLLTLTMFYALPMMVLYGLACWYRGWSVGSGIDKLRGISAPTSVLSLLMWVFAASILWWLPISHIWRGGTLFVAAAVITIVAGSFVLPRLEHPNANLNIWQRTVDVACCGLLAAAAFYMPKGLGPSGFHHWSPFIGSADAVRSGGWLLWNVPSQYGFGSALAIAGFPSPDIWQSFYYLNSAAITLGSVTLYCCLRSLFSGTLGSIFVLVATWAACLKIPGWQQEGLGPQYSPSIGGFRFLWVYVLWAMLWYVWIYRRGSCNLRRYLIFGNFIWLLGSLWSAESAFYCASIWFPQFLFAIRKALNEPRASEWRLLLLKWIGILIIQAISCGAMIFTFYLLYLGRWPDLSRFYDHAIAFTGGFGSLGVEFNKLGPVLLLILCLGYSYLYAWISDPNDGTGRVAATVSSLSLWTIASYFIMRSHDNNIGNILPFVILSLAALCAVNREDKVLLTKNSLVPLLITAIVTSLFPLTTSTSSKYDFHSAFDRMDRRIPPAGKELNVLIKEYTGQGFGVVVGIDLLPGEQAATGEVTSRRNLPWIPTPLSQLIPLHKRHQQIYVQRFACQFRNSGVFIVDAADLKAPITDYFVQMLEPSFNHSDSDIELRFGFAILKFFLRPDLDCSA